MALIQVNGTETVDTLVNLFSESILKTYATGINFHNLLLGDSIEITIIWNDPNAAAERIYDKFIVSGVQTSPGVYIPPLPTDLYKITAQKISGVNRAITWVRSEYT